MSVNIKKQIVARSIENEVSYGRGNKVLYIVIHETANEGKGANAQSHANLQSRGNSRNASWHYQVDDKQIIQSFKDSVECWHGSSQYYNTHSIGIEICVNSDGDFKKAVKKAAELAKYLRKKHKKNFDKIVTHYETSGGKNCPRHLRNNDWGVSWNEFKKMVDGAKGSVSKEKEKPSKPSAKPKGKLGLVDWMNSKGLDSSQSNRKKLASEYGISGYDFSADKNIALLAALQKGKPETNKKAKVKKGSKVTILDTAKTYATGETIPNSVKGKQYTVQQVGKNRVLIKEIYSWVRSHDVSCVGGASGSPTPSKKKPSKKVKKGATVTLSNSASNYATGESIPNSVKGKKYTVQQIKGNRVLLKEIYSWVNKTDVGGSTKKKKSKSKSIKKNSTVTLKKSASKFATGESIANHAKGKKYKVLQVKSDRVLLDGIMSWVKKKDVK